MQCNRNLHVIYIYLSNINYNIIKQKATNKIIVCQICVLCVFAEHENFSNHIYADALVFRARMVINMLFEDKKLFVFDMDGTLCLGNHVFPEAVAFVDMLRSSERRILFFTNNASHSRQYYMAKLTRMGFAPMDGEVMTAGDVTAEFLISHRAGKRVFLLGTEELRCDFSDRGILLSDLGDKSADIMVSSFDTSLTYEKLTHACDLVRAGAEFLCTHPDLNCPTEDGFVPDSGAIAALIRVCTGVEPRYFGKPYADTMKMICEHTGVSVNDAVIFGDRLYTDIALGKRSGASSVLVLTGETDLAGAEIAAENEKPDYIFPSMKEVCAEMFGTI